MDIERDRFKYFLMILLHDCKAKKFSNFVTFEFGGQITVEKVLNLQAIKERYDVDLSLAEKVK